MKKIKILLILSAMLATPIMYAENAKIEGSLYGTIYYDYGQESKQKQIVVDQLSNNAAENQYLNTLIEKKSIRANIFKNANTVSRGDLAIAYSNLLQLKSILNRKKQLYTSMKNNAMYIKALTNAPSAGKLLTSLEDERGNFKELATYLDKMTGILQNYSYGYGSNYVNNERKFYKDIDKNEGMSYLDAYQKFNASATNLYTISETINKLALEEARQENIDRLQDLETELNQNKMYKKVAKYMNIKLHDNNNASDKGDENEK